MKKTHLLFTLLTLISAFTFAQDAIPNFNFGFEENKNADELPDGWGQWGDYELTKDSENNYSGKHALQIKATEKGTFGSVYFRIPADYSGDEITLDGYMKLKNVSDGFAGLLMRVDGESGSLAFDNMKDKGISGTKDWEKHSITLPLSSEAKSIFIGGIITGKGTAWFDDFSVSIDGTPIEKLKPTVKPLSKAAMDKEFDAGSNISFDKLSAKEIDNLYLLCKVWGFVKYNHPEIAKGNVNWDYELFRIMPAITAKDFKRKLNKHIKALGTDFEAVELAKGSGEIKLTPNIDWLSDNDLLSKDLSKLLLKLKTTRKEKTNYHLAFAPGVGNPKFKKERTYKNMSWSDDGVKLLALFRYWNMIEYFFPYKELTDQKWETVIKDFIPRLVESNDELSYKLIMLDLIGKIQDTHANIWGRDKALTEFHGKNIAPIEINIVENQAVVVRTFEDLGSNSNIKIGDIISEINGTATAELIKEKAKYCPASNSPTQLRDVARRLLRTNDENLKLSIKKADKSITETVATVNKNKINFWSNDTPSHKELEGDVGYIYPGSLKSGEIHKIMTEFNDKKGLVIDLRCYPSDFIVFSLGQYLMPEPTAFVKFTAGSMSKTGQFQFGQPLYVGKKNEDYYKGKVVILINETSQSQAEYTTMALRVAPTASVIGSTTAGADGNVSKIVLPGNIKTMISGIGVYYPDGAETQRVGIVPDIEQRPTIDGIRSGRDELLETALELIKNGNIKD